MKSNFEHPFYSLRPNKYIDRILFVRLLYRLSPLFKFRLYTYIGFGSYTFEDFKLIHRQLEITKMISFEKEAKTYQRAIFNQPLGFIKIKQKNINDFIDNEDLPTKAIYWLDFTDPGKMTEDFKTFCSLLGKSSPNNIVRVTLNANFPSSRKVRDSSTGRDFFETDREKAKRFYGEVISKIGPFLRNSDINEETILKEYPKVLIRALKNAANETLPPTQGRIAVPLFATEYSDSTTMVTLTFVIVSNEGQKKKIDECLKSSLYNKDELLQIATPTLSLKERIELNKRIHSSKAIKTTAKALKEFKFLCSNKQNPIELENYIRFYQYYPNFHHFNL